MATSQGRWWDLLYLFLSDLRPIIVALLGLIVPYIAWQVQQLKRRTEQAERAASAARDSVERAHAQATVERHEILDAVRHVGNGNGKVEHGDNQS